MTGWTNNERGNVAIFFAVGCLAVAGLAAGGATMARIGGAGNRLQDIADGAAVAATVTAQDSRATEADIKGAAERFSRIAFAARRDAEPASMTVTVESRSPATVSVRFDQEVRTILAGFVGRDRIGVRRRATAVSGPERKTCLHVLDPTAAPALKLQGNPRLAAADCVVQVNSTAPGALHALSSSSAEAQATYVGGPASPVRSWAPAPEYGQPARPDPLVDSVDWPAPRADCRGQTAGENVLRPGHYCGGLVISRGLRLEPGLYVIQTGGVRVEGTGSSGRGVTLVLLDPAGAFDIRGGSRLSLSAPTSGPWAGIAVAAKPGAAMPTSTLQGNAALDLEGTLYLPGHLLKLQGSPRIAGTGGTRAVIVRRALLQGSPELQLTGGHPSGRYDAVRISR